MEHAPFLGQIQNIEDTSGTLLLDQMGHSMHRTMSTNNWGATNQLEQNVYGVECRH